MNRLYCTDVCCEWVSCLHTPVDFLELLPGNRNHHHLSDDVECHKLQLVIVSLATAMSKMKMLPTGFTVALCNTAIQFSDQGSNRSFLLLRTVDFLVDVVRSKRVPRFHQVSIAFLGIVSIQRQIWSLSKKLLRSISVQTKNPMFWRSAIVQLSYLKSRVFLERCNRKA